MGWMETDCWIYWDRPLKEMEKRIRKLSPDPIADVLKCDNSLRDSLAPDDIKFLGSVTSNQFRNTKAILGLGSPSKSAYKSHRKGYVYSEKVKKMAEQVKEECKDKVCAVVIQGEIKSQKMENVSSYIIGDLEMPENPYELEYTVRETDKWRKKTIEFSDMLDVKSFLESMIGSEQGSFISPYLRMVDSIADVYINTKTEKKDYEKVKYFQLI